MGVGYTFQDIYDVLGSRDTSDDSLTTVTLTAAYSATNRKILPIGGMSKAVLDVSYTTGAAETGMGLTIKVEFSPDRTNFYRAINDTTTNSESVLTERNFTFAAADSATNYAFSLPIDIYNKYIRISVIETGVSTNYGTVYIGATLSGAK